MRTGIFACCVHWCILSPIWFMLGPQAISRRGECVHVWLHITLCRLLSEKDIGYFDWCFMETRVWEKTEFQSFTQNMSSLWAGTRSVFSPLYPLFQDLCLAHSRCSINSFRMNEWTKIYWEAYSTTWKLITWGGKFVNTSVMLTCPSDKANSWYFLLLNVTLGHKLSLLEIFSF